MSPIEDRINLVTVQRPAGIETCVQCTRDAAGLMPANRHQGFRDQAFRGEMAVYQGFRLA